MIENRVKFLLSVHQLLQTVLTYSFLAGFGDRRSRYLIAEVSTIVVIWLVPLSTVSTVTAADSEIL